MIDWNEIKEMGYTVHMYRMKNCIATEVVSDFFELIDFCGAYDINYQNNTVVFYARYDTDERRITRFIEKVAFL